MDFNLSKEQLLIQKSFRDFADSVIAPRLEILEKECYIPEEIIAGLAELGAFGMPFKEEYGGAGAGWVCYSLMMEQLSRVSPGVSIMLAAHTGALMALNLFGSEEQKLKWMPAGCTGKEIWAFAFTEPATGSDPRQLTTTAREEGDYYVINGTKRFITNAHFTNGPCLTVAKTPGSDELSLFYVPKTYEGYSTSAEWEKIGQHGGPLRDSYFKDVKVPKEYKIGDKLGFEVLKKTVSYGKVGVCSNALGSALAAYDEAYNYVTTKTHRNSTIIKFQAVQMRLADVYTKYETARWMTYKLAAQADQAMEGELGDFPKQAAMTKYFVCDQAFQAARSAQLIHSAYGTVTDYQICRILRDASMGANLEGQQDMQQVIVASYLLGKTLQ